MEGMAVSRWDALLAAVAGYVAVVTLVRLMSVRRDDLVRDIRTKIAQERAAREAAEEAEADAEQAA